MTLTPVHINSHQYTKSLRRFPRAVVLDSDVASATAATMRCPESPSNARDRERVRRADDVSFVVTARPVLCMNGQASQNTARMQVVTLIGDLEEEIEGGAYIDSHGLAQDSAALAGELASAAATACAVSNAVLTGDISTSISRTTTATGRASAGGTLGPALVSGGGGGDGRAAAAVSAPLMRRMRTVQLSPAHRSAVRAVLSSTAIPEAAGVRAMPIAVRNPKRAASGPHRSLSAAASNSLLSTSAPES